MKDSSSKLNQYCSIHRYAHQEAYELCDYCMEHKHYLHHRDKYCNYGFSKFKIATHCVYQILLCIEIIIKFSILGNI